MNPQSLWLALFAALAVISVVESAWRLQRGRPASYANSGAEMFVGITLAVAAVLLNGGTGALALTTKALTAACFLLAAALRVAARRRFAGDGGPPHQ